MSSTAISNIISEKQDDTIMQQHQELKQVLAEAQVAQAFWKSTTKNLEFENLSMEWEMEIQTYRESLESAKGDDIKTLQADIRSRKSMLAKLREKCNGERVASAREAIRRFENQNALFLNPQANQEPTPEPGEPDDTEPFNPDAEDEA